MLLPSFSYKITILQDINKKGTYRIKRSWSFLDKELSLAHQLTEKDIKKDKKDKETEIYPETEICSYFPVALTHKHQHIIQKRRVQLLYEKESNKKDRTMLISNSNSNSNSLPRS